MNIKSIAKLAVTAVIGTTLIAGCGTSSSNNTSSNTTAGGKKEVVLKVGAVPVPHAEILDFIKPTLAKEGIDLEVVTFNDYIQPNRALSAGEIDANYFQHVPYLDDYNQQNHTNLVPTASVHFEPLGLYPGKSTSLKNIPSGATIAVPNDTTNEARALLLLQSANLIKLKDPKSLNETVQDITKNPHNIHIQEVDAAAIPRLKNQVNYAVINGNYALQAGYKISDALISEGANSLAAKTYANVVVVRSGDQNKPAIVALDKALQSAAVKNYINQHFKGSIIPVFLTYPTTSK